MKTHIWENREYIYKQTIDEKGHIVDVVRTPKFDTVFCVNTIKDENGIVRVKLGTTYNVIRWLDDDPVIICDDGVERPMWKGLFHD